LDATACLAGSHELKFSLVEWIVVLQISGVCRNFNLAFLDCRNAEIKSE
jgi:hypothetical protein